MQEQLISFETAKLAKEKGFNIFTDVCFANTPNSDDKQYKKIKLHHSHSVGSVDSFGNILTLVAYAPTQSLLSKWLREKHNIIILVLYDGKTFYYQIQRKEWEDCIIQFDLTLNQTYEEAYEIGLQEALKQIPNI